MGSSCPTSLAKPNPNYIQVSIFSLKPNPNWERVYLSPPNNELGFRLGWVRSNQIAPLDGLEPANQNLDYSHQNPMHQWDKKHTIGSKIIEILQVSNSSSNEEKVQLQNKRVFYLHKDYRGKLWQWSYHIQNRHTGLITQDTMTLCLWLTNYYCANAH